MTETKTGPYIDGDVSKTGATRRIREDKIIPPQNAPRPVGPQPKQ